MSETKISFNRSLLIKIRNASSLALNETSNDIVNELKAAAPVKTGALRKSIRQTTTELESVFKMLGYAWFLEFGTHKMSAQPFVHPTFFNQKTKWERAFILDVGLDTGE